MTSHPTTMQVVSWSLPGYPDEVALAAGSGRLWVAASTATLAREDVWFGELTADGVEREARVIEDEPCCRPALTGLDNGALALACAPGRMFGACDADGSISRWSHVFDGIPVHIACVAIGSRAYVAVELARAGDRFISLLVLDPETGTIYDRRRLGGDARWCRWPVLAIAGTQVAIAWCEGPARMPGVVKIARWTDALGVAQDVSFDAGEAPALAVLPDGAIAIAWHCGGVSEAVDHRDASVVRTIEVAIARLGNGAVIAARPPPGAGGNVPRGEDQGWELPALAAEPGGALILVGRSSHGHHVARRGSDGVWTAPMALDAGGWGARGRRHALARHHGELWLARRAPEGVLIGICPQPSRGAAAARVSRVTHPRVDRARPQGVLYGDLHQHTAHSDGCGSVEELWIAARDQRGLDFGAVTDHDQFCRRALGPATWQITTQVAAAFDEPGRFVALAGYEFTGPRHPGPGHKCVYFGDRVPERVPERDVAAVFALVRELGGIAVPHHVGWTGADFAHHDPDIQPVWEICSVHGCYEGDGACPAHPPRTDHIIPGHFVRDALAAGLRFGFIGSTDSHGLDWHHGIARWRNPFRAGLACVIGAEPTRAGILAALRSRRSYATTGAKIAVRAELDGAAIGSELPGRTSGELFVEVTGTAAIRKIVVVDVDGEHALELDSSGVHARARGHIAVREGTSYVYVRIEQVDDEAAWLSPFWLGGT
jgi:hypothetical protein